MPNMKAGSTDRHGADRPGGQFAAVIEPLQRRQDRLHAGGIEERGDAKGIQHRDRPRHRRAIHLRGVVAGIWRARARRCRRRLRSSARSARRWLEIAADLAIVRVGRRPAVTPASAQRRRVGPAVVIAVVAQQHRMAEARRVEQRPAPSAVLSVGSRSLPNWPPTIQAPGRRLGCRLATRASAISECSSVRRKAQLEQIGLAAHHDVVVDVDDPRHRHPPAEIDDRRARARSSDADHRRRSPTATKRPALTAAQLAQGCCRSTV